VDCGSEKEVSDMFLDGSGGVLQKVLRPGNVRVSTDVRLT
jgi:hypothetical protein